VSGILPMAYINLYNGRFTRQGVLGADGKPGIFVHPGVIPISTASITAKILPFTWLAVYMLLPCRKHNADNP